MQIIRSEYITFWDVDETLVMHDIKGSPYCIAVDDTLNPDKRIRVIPNSNMIRLLKEEKHRGATVLVWSKGGYEWATNVIKALKLEEHVDYVLSKPIAYFDDKEINQWLTYRVYIPPTAAYKQGV